MQVLTLTQLRYTVFSLHFQLSSDKFFFSESFSFLIPFIQPEKNVLITDIIRILTMHRIIVIHIESQHSFSITVHPVRLSNSSGPVMISTISFCQSFIDMSLFFYVYLAAFTVLHSNDRHSCHVIFFKLGVLARNLI